MNETNRVEVKLSGLLHTLRRREGKDTVVSVEVPPQGIQAWKLAEDLGLPLDKIEGVFLQHKAHGLDIVIKPGGSIAFVPSGTPGPHRYTLGLYHAGRKTAEA